MPVFMEMVNLTLVNCYTSHKLKHDNPTYHERVKLRTVEEAVEWGLQYPNI